MNKNWQKAAEVLEDGGVVILPSDSSYGIAALVENETAIKKLYQIKNREEGKPSLIIIGNLSQAKDLVNFSELGENLAQKHWPGGLTIVSDSKTTSYPPLIYGENNSLALRLPNKIELQELAQQVGPFILPSANLAGLKPPFAPEEIDEALKTQVDFVLDEPTDGNNVSTLVDARGETPVILRPGSVILD